MKIYFLFVTTIIFIGCKKSNESVPDKNYGLFSKEELEWITNIKNPHYQVLIYSKNNLGQTIKVVDTLQAQTLLFTEIVSDTIGDYYTALHKETWNFGTYSMVLRDSSFNDEIAINISNKEKFSATFKGNNSFEMSTPDTLTVNGIFYTDIYKLTLTYRQSYPNIQTAYFKKGIGFLYLKSGNGNEAFLIK